MSIIINHQIYKLFTNKDLIRVDVCKWKFDTWTQIFYVTIIIIIIIIWH